MNEAQEKFFQMATHPFKFSLYLMRKLPAAFFSGCKVKEVNREKCTISVPYKWLTTNPFSSTYFASLSMAAELSTGLLAISNIYQSTPRVSMLLTGMEGRFFKKAVGKTFFTCNQGEQITSLINEAIATGEGKAISVTSTGYSEKKEIIAEFSFHWSFKVKSRQC